jgi:predicted MFS family arabinose efflux permease
MPTVVFLHIEASRHSGRMPGIRKLNIDAPLRFYLPGWSFWHHSKGARRKTRGKRKESDRFTLSGFSSQSWHTLCLLGWSVIAPKATSDSPHPKPMLRMGLLFGVIYFVQGMSEPTTGLVSQPDQSLLRDWGKAEEEVTFFAAMLTLPWCLKPLFGLLSDFVPLGKYRRKSYLLIASALGVAGFIGLLLTPLPSGAERPLLSWLMLSAIAVVCSDVVIDALMIDTSRPMGLTGRMQSVQWASIYGGAVVTGILGGLLSEHHQQKIAFALCTAMLLVTVLMTVFFVDENPAAAGIRWRSAVPSLWKAVRSPGVLVVSGLMFLWNFNPFSQAALYVYTTKELELDERVFGNMTALNAVGSLAACIGYGFYCRRVPMRWLVHLSIVAGIASNCAYWLLSDKTSALALSVAVGLIYMTGCMVQVDLAARVCPPEATGTLFALLMATCNLGTAISTWFGGIIYRFGADRLGAKVSFWLLIGVGSLFTLGCWLIVRFLPADLDRIGSIQPSIASGNQTASQTRVRSVSL